MSGVLEKFTSIPKDENGCMVWPHATLGHGYGMVTLLGQSFRAHRLVYALMVGSIPDSKQIDHLCNNPACVNTDHMELVTNAENQRRRSERYTQCKRGHDMADAYIKPDGHRQCQKCQRELERAVREGTHVRRPRGARIVFAQQVRLADGEWVAYIQRPTTLKALHQFRAQFPDLEFRAETMESKVVVYARSAA